MLRDTVSVVGRHEGGDALTVLLASLEGGEEHRGAVIGLGRIDRRVLAELGLELGLEGRVHVGRSARGGEERAFSRSASAVDELLVERAIAGDERCLDTSVTKLLDHFGGLGVVPAVEHEVDVGGLHLVDGG